MDIEVGRDPFVCVNRMSQSSSPYTVWRVALPMLSPMGSVT